MVFAWIKKRVQSGSKSMAMVLSRRAEASCLQASSHPVGFGDLGKYQNINAIMIKNW